MKVFVLDDMEVRLEWFRTRLCHKYKAIVVTAKTVSEAITCFEMHNDFDAIFLDHDLGERAFVDSSDPETGFQVAKYIRDNNINAKLIVVHSLNYGGAMNILSVLPSAKYIPYSLLQTTI